MAKKSKSAVEALRDAIRSSGLTVYAVAKKSGVGVDSVYRFMSGQRDLRFTAAAKIADTLGLELTKRK